MPNAVALREFTHPKTGQIVPRRSVIALDTATYRALRDLGDVIQTDEEERPMTKIMALKKTAHPKTGETIFATQVVALEDDAAGELIASGAAAATDEPETQDVGALAMRDASR